MSRAHWARGGAPRCTATLGRNGPCGTQAGAFGQSGAAQNLRTEEWSGEEINRYVEDQMRIIIKRIIKRMYVYPHSALYNKPCTAAAQMNTAKHWAGCTNLQASCKNVIFRQFSCELLLNGWVKNRLCVCEISKQYSSKCLSNVSKWWVTF